MTATRTGLPEPVAGIVVRYESAILLWMDLLPLDLLPGRRCRACDEQVDRRRRHGPAPGFCSDACRQAAYRRRQRGLPESSPRQARAGRRRTLGEQAEPSRA